MPAKVEVDGPTGLMSLEARGHWFRPMPLPIELTAQALNDGVELVGSEIALSFEPVRYSRFTSMTRQEDGSMSIASSSASRTIYLCGATCELRSLPSGKKRG